MAFQINLETQPEGGYKHEGETFRKTHLRKVQGYQAQRAHHGNLPKP